MSFATGTFRTAHKACLGTVDILNVLLCSVPVPSSLRGDRFNATGDCEVHSERNTETPREEINVRMSRACLLSLSDPGARKP